MESFVLTPKNKKQAEQLIALAKELDLKIGILNDEDREDAALLRAMKEGEKDKRSISLKTFFKNLRS